jgi:hypothetical protein
MRIESTYTTDQMTYYAIDSGDGYYYNYYEYYSSNNTVLAAGLNYIYVSIPCIVRLNKDDIEGSIDRVMKLRVLM